MTPPPDKFDPKTRHVLTGSTLNKLRESVIHRTPKTSNDIIVVESPDGFECKLKDRKTAILPLDLGNGLEWVAWTCVEADRAIFRIVRDIQRGEQLQIPAEMLGSCEPGSLQVVSTMPLGGLALVSAEVVDQARVSWALAELPGIEAPHSVRVAIEGTRLGMPEIWPRTTEDVAEANRLFWQSAHEPQGEGSK